MTNISDNNLTSQKIDEFYNEAVRLAKSYSDQGNFVQAVKEYLIALEFRPTQIQAMGELCWCLGQIDKPEEMLEWAKKALLISQKRGSKDNIGRFYFYIGQYYKMTEQYEKAIDYFTLTVANKPYFLGNYLDMAFCRRQLGHFPIALELYDLIKKKDEDYAKENNIDELIAETKADYRLKNRELIHMDLGNEQEKNGQLELANKSYYTALEINPKHLSIIFFLFMNEIKLKSDYYKIISIGEQLYMLINANDKLLEYYYMLSPLCKGLSLAYNKIGNSEKEEFYSKEFDFYDYIGKAKTAIKENTVQEAIDNYKKALTIKENNFEVLDELIELCFNLNQLDEAMDYAIDGLKQAKLVDNKNYIAKYQFDIGCRFEKSGYDKAIEFFMDAYNGTENSYDKLKYCRKIAYYYSSKSDSEKTIEYLKKCKDCIKSGATDIYDIDSEIIKQQELRNKNSDLSRALDHYNIGAKYFNEMNFEEAAKEMQISLDLIPQDLDTMDILNRCLYKLKRFDECYDVAYAGYMISCRDHDYRFIDMFCYNVANILYNSQRYEGALRFYLCASYYKPEDTDYLYFTAATYRNMGKFSKAVEYFNKVVEIDPNDQAAKEQLMFCYKKMKEQ